MRRLQAGDDAALAALMQHWEIPLKRVLARIVQNTAEADDLAQETFVRVYQQRARFRPDAAFRPWLFTIAVNLARNRLRWWRRRPAVSLEAWTTDTPGHEPADPSEAPAAGLARRERAAHVREAVARLPRDLREAIVLFEFEQMSQAEIAVTLGCTIKAVETRVYRARAALRRSLADA
jgi:RNA polymerase sigma-70 factor (ECF subfamily)